SPSCASSPRPSPSSTMSSVRLPRARASPSIASPSPTTTLASPRSSPTSSSHSSRGPTRRRRGCDPAPASPARTARRAGPRGALPAPYLPRARAPVKFPHSGERGRPPRIRPPGPTRRRGPVVTLAVSTHAHPEAEMLHYVGSLVLPLLLPAVTSTVPGPE